MVNGHRGLVQSPYYRKIFFIIFYFKGCDGTNIYIIHIGHLAQNFGQLPVKLKIWSLHGKTNFATTMNEQYAIIMLRISKGNLINFVVCLQHLETLCLVCNSRNPNVVLCICVVHFWLKIEFAADRRDVFRFKIAGNGIWQKQISPQFLG